MAGSLAYYTIFALPPLLVVIIAIVGLALGKDMAQGEITKQIQGLLGQQGGGQVKTMIQGAAASPGKGIAATIIGARTGSSR